MKTKCNGPHNPEANQEPFLSSVLHNQFLFKWLGISFIHLYHDLGEYSILIGCLLILDNRHLPKKQCFLPCIIKVNLTIAALEQSVLICLKQLWPTDINSKLAGNTKHAQVEALSACADLL